MHRDASGQVLNRVRGGDLDGGYALIDAAPEDLAADRLAPIGLAVALPMRFAAQAASLSRAEVVGLPWIVSVPACAATLDLFRDGGRAPEARHVADSDGVLRSMIVSGLGAGILRCSEAEAGERAGEMAIWPHWRGSAWLCWVQAAANASPAVAAMREVVGESWREAAARCGVQRGPSAMSSIRPFSSAANAGGVAAADVPPVARSKVRTSGFTVRNAVCHRSARTCRIIPTTPATRLSAPIMTGTPHPAAPASDPPFDVEWDAGDLGCGELLLKLRVRLRTMPGRVIRVTARDLGAIEDLPSYCRVTGHALLHADAARSLFWIKAKG